MPLYTRLSPTVESDCCVAVYPPSSGRLWVKSTSGETTLAASARPRRADDLLRRGELTLCGKTGCEQMQHLTAVSGGNLFTIHRHDDFDRIAEA